jgi:hypothetical protein
MRGLAIGALALGLSTAAWAGPLPEGTAVTLTVDGSAASNGDGTAARPFWSITEAIVRARAVRQTTAQRIVVNVAPLPPVPSRTLPAPAAPLATPDAGSLPSGIYTYRIAAFNAYGITLASDETSIAIAGPAGVNLTWTPVDGAAGYFIYGRTAGKEAILWAVASGTPLSFTDDIWYFPYGTLPVRNSTGDGVYEGNFEPHSSATDRHEVLPILLNVKDLTLHGASVLVRDADGFATGEAVEGTQTKVMAIDAPSDGSTQHAILLATRTADGRGGDGTVIEGLVLDAGGFGGGWVGGAADTLVGTFLVQRVKVRNNIAQNGSANVLTMLSSVDFEGNCSAWSGAPAFVSIAGSPNDPAVVHYQGNRSVNDYAAMILCGAVGGFTGSAVCPWEAGGNVAPVVPQVLPAAPATPGDVPNGLLATVVDNNLSGNWFSLRLMSFGRGESYPSLPSAVLNAAVIGNRMDDNVLYGVFADEGFMSRAGPRPTATLDVVFAGNSLLRNNAFDPVANPTGNGRGALFTFTLIWDFLGQDFSGFMYMVNSVYRIADLDGELGRAGIDIDNPASDPFDGTPLDNTIVPTPLR